MRMIQTMDVINLNEVPPFITKDGSEIREWAGRVAAPAVNQSLAEATLPPGGAPTERRRATPRSAGWRP